MDVWCTPDCTDFDVNGAVGTLTISDIISFVDVLSISNITDLDNLVICNSPGLRILELPLVTSLSSIVISDADILQEIFLPMLIPGNTRVTDSGSYTEDQLPLSLNITNAPILNEVDLKNSGSWKDLILSGTNSFFPVRAQIGVTSSLRAYGCVEFLDLVEVGSLQLTVDSNDSYLCGYSLNNLTSVGNLTIFNTDVLNGEAFAGSNLIQVNNSLILKPSIPAHPPTTRFDTKFGRISAITNNFRCQLNVEHVNIIRWTH
ncbi:hypothetical protein RRF57_012472 [Xylaria bambusicola]|uniref:Uncharacterized protein n=1 Tax=Xylaria bambusicola TaxID=326684 RepID=A0AAN7UPS8_9PEZI